MQQLNSASKALTRIDAKHEGILAGKRNEYESHEQMQPETLATQ